MGAVLAGARGALPDFPLTYDELKVKTGYYTEDGKYLSGVPQWFCTLEREIYECLEYSDGTNTTARTSSSIFDTNATSDDVTCIEWRADEAGGNSFELGFCTCKSLGREGHCCEAWACSESNERSCIDSYDCFVNIDAAVCECNVVNESGYFCESRSCKQTDSQGKEEFEYYDCAWSSSSAHYCES